MKYTITSFERKVGMIFLKKIVHNCEDDILKNNCESTRKYQISKELLETLEKEQENEQS